jgi:small-conductance mechanosensitive channel
MSTLSKEPEQPITAEQIEAWLHTTQSKRLALHVQATASWNSLSRQQAFMEMSDLLQEALEEVRVISTTLREESQALRAHIAEVREHAAQLRARPHRMKNTDLHYGEIRGDRLYLIEYNNTYLIAGDSATKKEMNQEELAAYLHSRSVQPCLIAAVCEKLLQKGAVALAKESEHHEWVIAAFV